MELTIKEQKENPLLNRKEVYGEIQFKGATPSNKEVSAELAKKMKVNEGCIRIQHIYGTFGTQAASLEAHVYESKEQLDKIEPKIKEKKQEE